MLKFLKRPASTPNDVPEVNAPAADNPVRAARSDLIDRIGTFLLDHDLDISPANLALAHAAFSGADLALAQRIAERQIAGDRIDQAWFDQQRPKEREPEQAGERNEIDALMGRLDSSIATFADATTRAHGTTSAYGDTLKEQVGLIGAEGVATGEVLSSLAGIARAMLERTREVEQEMRRSANEANGLRQSLERARREAEIDHLTGLPNRRAFEGVLEVHYREAQADIDLLSVAFCDIDHFKAVNDNHGHETGDRVIQAIGQVLSRISDDRCHVARHGGEEFVMLFRGRSVTEAQAILDAARQQLAERRFINRITDEPIGRITFSGGVADAFGWPDPRAALRAADEALYRAKAEGRNRICIAGRP